MRRGLASKGEMGLEADLSTKCPIDTRVTAHPE
jgi:hypothetical protein